MIKAMIEQQAIYAAKSGDGEVIEAQFRNFTPKKDLLEHYIKNLIGTPVGKPEVKVGQVVGGVDTEIKFDTLAIPCIGFRIQVSIPRDKPLAAISCIMEYDKSGINNQQTFKIQPSKNGEICTFIVLGAFNIDTEIFPITLNTFVNAGAEPPIDRRQQLTILDGDAPEGTSVTVWKLNLSDTKLRNYVKALAKKNS